MLSCPILTKVSPTILAVALNDLPSSIHFQIYDERLDKQNEAYIDVISGSDELRANVTDLDDTWGIVLPHEEDFNLYEAYFE
ncbi:hypothetical protein [Natranaerobius trueperi]|uniref:hypothetical protein n=1 Tax=Natranaerobius trueperi TaxID=759412 RepID=UPI00117CEEA1|nr:hypothetical protein [Natranaerobius trueperi]